MSVKAEDEVSFYLKQGRRRDAARDVPEWAHTAVTGTV
jgi:hypothetical protein